MVGITNTNINKLENILGEVGFDTLLSPLRIIFIIIYLIMNSILTQQSHPL